MTGLDKLRWQCRRGTLELDLLLQRYLNQEYLQADEEEKRQFVELIDWEDGELLQVFLGGNKPEKSGYDSLISKIRRIAAF